MVVMTNEKRRKCYNLLIDKELDEYSYESFKNVLSHILMYGARDEAYTSMSDHDLLNTVFYNCDHHDLEAMDEGALFEWIDEQEVPDYVGQM